MQAPGSGGADRRTVVDDGGAAGLVLAAWAVRNAHHLASLWVQRNQDEVKAVLAIFVLA